MNRTDYPLHTVIFTHCYWPWLIFCFLYLEAYVPYDSFLFTAWGDLWASCCFTLPIANLVCFSLSCPAIHCTMTSKPQMHTRLWLDDKYSHIVATPFFWLFIPKILKAGWIYLSVSFPLLIHQEIPLALASKYTQKTASSPHLLHYLVDPGHYHLSLGLLPPPLTQSLCFYLCFDSIFSIYVEMEVTIVTPMIKIFLCIPTSLSIKVLVPKMTYKTLSTMSLLLLYPHLCSLLCLLRTSHTDLSALSLISQESSCFKTFALAVLPAWDVHPLDFCLILSWPPLCLYSNVIFSVTTSPFKITTHCPLPPCQHSLSWHCASFFFTIALITIRYAKYFSCLF